MQAALLARGVWLYVKYNLCVIAPPLTIARDELESGLEIVAEVLREFAARLRT
ncbi:hypothetical protein ACSFBI_30820 [Variovorax sp. RB3P1]|uniref:hypothetical protein n=1 Tax=Variovorax sp. RB3P1 TaxID=3443732 RepID=UPI003F45B487